VKEVVRIVSGLQFPETPVVMPVCRGDRVARLVAGVQIVHIAAGSREGCHRCEGLAGPGDAPISDGGVPPFGQHYKIIADGAMRKGRIADSDPAHGAVEMLEKQLTHGSRTAGEAFDNPVDRVITELSEEARLPMVESAPWIGRV